VIGATAAPQLLDELRALPAESEWLDFKEAKRNFDLDDLGKYVSALANEANLGCQPFGWLVLGVEDRCDPSNGMRPVVGSSFKLGAGALNDLKLHIAQHTSPTLSSIRAEEIFHADCANGSRVLMLGIPPAPRGMPVSWKGHFYGRAGESLVALGDAKYELIRSQAGVLDWTAQRVSNDSSLLDAQAIQDALELYLRKHPGRAREASAWTVERFLTELGLRREGELTRAALLLFGTAASASYLGEIAPRISWKLLDAGGSEIDYTHFKLPLIKAIDGVASKIRLHTVRILPPGQLAPLEMPSYDGWVIREALLNCIAHQDYAQGGRVVVTEWPDALWFSNEGSFIPGSVETVLANLSAIHRYRNPCLTDAMVDLGLIDTIGSGIRRMFRTQRERLFPLPDYELGDSPPTVKVCVYGREIDAAFGRMLLTAMDLTLEDVIALDRVQKKKSLSPEVVKSLRARGLVEGRGVAVRLSGTVAKAVGQEVSYTLNRGLDTKHYKALVLELLAMGPQPRAGINGLLLGKLPGAVAVSQQKTYVKNLLRDMADRDGTIEAFGGMTRAARWRLKAKPPIG